MKTSTQKKQTLKDWHRADIKAALDKADFNFARIAREYGFKGSAQTVLKKPWPTIEAIIGEILGIHPSKIWPSRYDANGTPLKCRLPINVPKRNSSRNGEQSPKTSRSGAEFQG